ncbi:hypothetical protein PTKIN_Ptkin07bG0249400 [Pterospermum kingtungense]
MLVLMFYTLWALWKNKNSACFELHSLTPSLSVMVHKLVDEASQKLVQPHTCGIKVPIQWSVPSDRCFKINVDAAYRANVNKAVIVVVARSSTGDILVSVAKGSSFVDLVLHAELLAIRFGVELFLFQDLSSVIIETDSLLAVKEINKGASTLSEWGGLVMDILSLTSVLGVSIEQANGCAHNLTKFSFERIDYSFWAGKLSHHCCNPDIAH